MIRSGSLYVLSAILCGIIATASLPAVAQTGPSVPFVTIARGTKSNIRVATLRVVRDQAAWQALWRRHSRAAPPSSVNFNRHMVIAVFAGEFPEPAGAAVIRITRELDRLVVLYRVGPTRPVPDGGGIRTTPFHIVRTARSKLPVAFKQMKTPPIVRQQP